MVRPLLTLAGCLLLPALSAPALAGGPGDLRVGVAGHAFDHLGPIGEQAEAAVASGANIIYVSGLGGLGYEGLPSAEAIARQRQATAAYLRKAKRQGIRLAIGYVCATSIVKLEGFDKNWAPRLPTGLHEQPGLAGLRTIHGSATIGSGMRRPILR